MHYRIILSALLICVCSTAYGFAQTDTGRNRIQELDRTIDRLVASGERSQLRRAVQLYKEIIREANARAPTPEANQVTVRHVAHILLVMPESLHSQVVEERHSRRPNQWRLTDGAGNAILRWIRSKDPLPSSLTNEWIYEHIGRVAYAQREYGDPSRVTGIDDRGEALIRYGNPSRVVEVDYTDFDFYSEVFRFGVAVNPNSFPNHELWFYDNIDSRVYYLFVERGSGYRQGTTRDLLPKRLQRGFQGARGRNHAYSAVYAMRHIYEQLALSHTDFGERYTEIANYIARQEELDMMETMGSALTREQGKRQIGDGTGERTTFEDPTLGLEGVGVTARRILSQSWSEDEQAARQRRRIAPQSRTQVLDDVNKLDVSYRVIRSLSEEGGIYTDIYWEILASALQIPEELSEMLQTSSGASPSEYLIRASATLFNNTYQRQEYVMNHEPHVFGEQDRVQGYVRLTGYDDLYHVGLQWNQYALDAEEGISPVVRLHTSQVDSIVALRTDGSLEMSDLRPVQYSEIDKFINNYTIVNKKIGVYESLAIQFEVYNLSFDSEDRTRYTLEYEMDHIVPRRGLIGRFRGNRTRETATETTYEGESQRVEEYIILDLSEVAPHGDGEIVITVRITDEHTGQTVERKLQFFLN